MGTKLGGEEKLVVKLTLTLERSRVHELDCDGLSGSGQNAREYRSEATVADPGGEAGGGVAEGGVGEAKGRLWLIGIRRRGGAFSGAAAKTERSEKEEGTRWIWVDGDHLRRCSCR